MKALPAMVKAMFNKREVTSTSLIKDSSPAQSNMENYNDYIHDCKSLRLNKKQKNQAILINSLNNKVRCKMTPGGLSTILLHLLVHTPLSEHAPLLE